jgi:hypothetical protein
MQRKLVAQQLQLEIEPEKPAIQSRPPARSTRQLLASAASGPPARSSNQAQAARTPSAEALLHNPDALLTRTHLRLLGLERRAIDAVFRALPVVALPGYRRPMIHARDYLDLVAENTFRDDRVRPIARAS